MTQYQVQDIQTGRIVGTYATRKRADTVAYQLDLQYGATRYAVLVVNT